MICIVETPIDLANFVELNNLINNGKGKSNGKKSVSVLSWADFSKMENGEKLYLLAHASKTHIGESPAYTGPDFADVLLNKNLPGHIDKIVLVACESGLATTGTQPLCQVIHDQLKRKSNGSVDVPVTGFSGFAVTNKAGQTRALDPAKEKKYSTQYNDIFDRFDRKIEYWQTDAKNLPTSNQDELINGATIMARKSKDFFEELYDINKKMVKSKSDSKVYGK